MFGKAGTRNLPASRHRLTEHSFTRLDNGVWVLTLPALYAELFERQEPTLFQKTEDGWRDTGEGDGQKECYGAFTEAEVGAVRTFLADFGQWVILGLGHRLKPFFSDELDTCVALDFNADSPEAMARFHRTPIGQLELRAKYEESERATAVIAEHLDRLHRRICRGLPEGQHNLSYIPSSADKPYDLPKELARLLEEKLAGNPVPNRPIKILHPTLTTNKPNLKALPLAEKIAAWKKLQESQAIEFSREFAGQTVIVIDDLYQSGATIWSYAGHLKAMGAAAVIGMVCVKSLRDTDNL